MVFVLTFDLRGDGLRRFDETGHRNPGAAHRNRSGRGEGLTNARGSAKGARLCERVSERNSIEAVCDEGGRHGGGAGEGSEERTVDRHKQENEFLRQMIRHRTRQPVPGSRTRPSCRSLPLLHHGRRDWLAAQRGSDWSAQRACAATRSPPAPRSAATICSDDEQ